MNVLKNKHNVIILLLVVGISALLSFWFFNKSSEKLTNNSGSSSKNISPKTDVSDLVFNFAVQADPHMDENSDSNVYKQTISQINASSPKFLIDLGDIFMVDKQDDKSEANLRSRYTLMKGFYDLLDSKIPLHFAMGNHDGEVGWDKLNTKYLREQYFPNETSDKNYYSITQDNALMVVLDPYTYTTTKPSSDSWLWTLGKTQYDWLKTTLETSRATHKYVFIHQLVGGDNQGRGGIEYAKMFEWGGNNTDGTYGFNTHRPGWGKPIHQLLKDNGVEIVFKGHDHVYVKQDLDGITYQTLPQPSHLGESSDTAGKYGYTNGDIVGGSGYLKVSVGKNSTQVTFIKSDGIVAANYTK